VSRTILARPNLASISSAKASMKATTEGKLRESAV
jgi:hypothetical protein